MTRRWTRLAPLTLALFAAHVAAPRTGLFFHHHDGDTVGHTHADDGGGLDSELAELIAEAVHHDHTHAHGHSHSHATTAQRHNHRSIAQVPKGQPWIEPYAPADHWHATAPFHPSLATLVVAPDVVATAIEIIRETSQAPPSAPAPARTARGPPQISA